MILHSLVAAVLIESMEDVVRTTSVGLAPEGRAEAVDNVEE
jgi:hypothetical protein